MKSLSPALPVSSLCRRTERGAALLAVLWIIALLIALVAGASLLLLQDVDMSATRRQMTRARMIAEAGLAIALNPAVNKNDDPLLRQEVGPGERFMVEKVGEDGLVNPNVLLQREDRETLRRIFRYWGMQLQQADALIDALLDWVDGDDFVRIRGAESKAYGRNGMPFNRPFRSIEEMAMVRGMREVEMAYPAWRSWFSVYASGVLDLKSAQPEVISAVTGAELRACQVFRTLVLGRDGILNTDDDYPSTDLGDILAQLQLPTTQATALQGIVGTSSATNRILVRVQVGELQRQLGAVVRGAVGAGGTQILWMGER